MSPTNARKGSIDMFMDASMIHSIPAATYKAGEFGMINRAMAALIAPIRKYGILRPKRPHAFSPMEPLIVCTTRPVNGAPTPNIVSTSTFVQ